MRPWFISLPTLKGSTLDPMRGHRGMTQAPWAIPASPTDSTNNPRAGTHSQASAFRVSHAPGTPTWPQMHLRPYRKEFSLMGRGVKGGTC